MAEGVRKAFTDFTYMRNLKNIQKTLQRNIQRNRLRDIENKLVGATGAGGKLGGKEEG